MEKNSYLKMKEEQQERINKLDLKFAFSDEQFKKAMDELGLKENETDKIVSIGAGGFCLKETADKLNQYCKEYQEAKKEAFKNDEFLQDAFEYELGNHEYIITYDLEETLDALSITKEYYKNKRYQRIMKKAIASYKKDMEALGW